MPAKSTTDPERELHSPQGAGNVVDLRSDTVTRPTPAMRRAMAEAEVGDDVYLEDPTVNGLEARAAEIFGKEAALFVPSGCMGNLIAIKVWTHHGDEVICEERSHVNLYELASMSAIAGCMPRVARSEDGILTWAEIEAVIRPKIYYDSQTALVCLENTHNMAGGTLYTTAQISDICNHAHAVGLKVHLDGARVFNAAVALGVSVSEIARDVDSVMFCLSKGLGAPVGSMVVGSHASIAKCLAAACVRWASSPQRAELLSKSLRSALPSIIKMRSSSPKPSRKSQASRSIPEASRPTLSSSIANKPAWTPSKYATR
jgi:threonine aldolase